MTISSSYPHGLPYWVAVICPDDAEPAMAFYSALFGWDYLNIAEGPDDPPFYIATLDGGRVASLAGSGNGEPGVWITAVSVEDLDGAAAAVNSAGGSAPPDDTVEIDRIGRFHRVHDPAGAEIHLLQVEGTPVERSNEPGAWSISSLRVAETALVAPFYRAVFDWHLDASDPAALSFRLPRYVDVRSDPWPRDIVGTIELDDQLGEAVWTPTFQVTDLEACLDHATAHHGRILAGPEASLSGLRARLADPGGATFTVHQPAK